MFCESLREHAIKKLILKRKEMKLLTPEQQEPYENAKICYICKEKFEDKYLKDKNYCKFRDHCHYAGKYRGAAHNICNSKYSIPKDIILYLKKLLEFFTMDHIMTIILSQKSWQ